MSASSVFPFGHSIFGAIFPKFPSPQNRTSLILCLRRLQAAKPSTMHQLFQISYWTLVWSICPLLLVRGVPWDGAQPTSVHNVDDSQGWSPLPTDAPSIARNELLVRQNSLQICGFINADISKSLARNSNLNYILTAVSQARRTSARLAINVPSIPPTMLLIAVPILTTARITLRASRT